MARGKKVSALTTGSRQHSLRSAFQNKPETPDTDPAPAAFAAAAPQLVLDDPIVIAPAAPPRNIPVLHTTKNYDIFLDWSIRKGFEDHPLLCENSDVDVSQETITALGTTAKMIIHLKGLSDIVEACAHQRRRLMFGNDRLSMIDFQLKNGLMHTIKNWYSKARGDAPDLEGVTSARNVPKAPLSTSLVSLNAAEFSYSAPLSRLALSVHSDFFAPPSTTPIVNTLRLFTVS